MKHRVAIVSRIFQPEPAAASFRLAALGRALDENGAAVRVITSTAPKNMSETTPDLGRVDVRRAPVLRDRDGYVRGYLNYLSFDIPAFFRILFGPRYDVVVVEPPPTTGFMMRLACGLRRIPYIYYAADVWADAVTAVGVPVLVARAVRLLELFSLKGATAILSVSDAVTDRLRELGVDGDVVTIGNGVDTRIFTHGGESIDIGRPYLLYAGTASEVHGAMIFAEAFERVIEEHPDACLVFLGQGAELESIRNRVACFPEGSTRFLARQPASVVGAWVRGAKATLASMRPGVYAIAFPTKMYASVACGTPVIYAGDGAATEFASTPGVGWSIPYEVDALAEAMAEALTSVRSAEERDQLALWADSEVSLREVARRGAAVVQAVINQ